MGKSTLMVFAGKYCFDSKGNLLKSVQQFNCIKYPQAMIAVRPLQQRRADSWEKAS